MTVRIENPKHGPVRIFIDDQELLLPPVGQAVVLRPKVLHEPHLEHIPKPGEEST